MRLLRLKDNGACDLVKFVGKNIPPYAILSHTWGEEHDEVDFKDFKEGNIKGKPGYAKIQFCAAQVIKDNLQYFWVDTCCIDKSTSAELSEALNSMFRWYHNAVKCYVYMSDVSIDSFNEGIHSSQSLGKLAFKQSRWFTRGWTLQELLAPSSVEFFSCEGKSLGDKKSLEHQIYKITGISIQALQGSPLSDFSFAERIS